MGLGKIEEISKETKELGGSSRDVRPAMAVAKFQPVLQRKQRGRMKKLAKSLKPASLGNIEKAGMVPELIEEYSQSLEEIMATQVPEGSAESGDVIEHLMQKDNKMMNLVTQVRGEGLLGLFQEEKKKFQSSFDNSFLKESKSGNQAIDLFLDRANPYNKTAHPALPNVIKELNARHLKRVELMKAQELLYEVQTEVKRKVMDKDNLVNKARNLGVRASQHTAKVINQLNREKEEMASVWEERFKEEAAKTIPLQEVCSALREDMELQHKKRMESIDIKMDKIPFKSKGPSREENYKILAIRTLYEIASLHPRLKHTRQRAEFEERRAKNIQEEVTVLRERISFLKNIIMAITKGVHNSKQEAAAREKEKELEKEQKSRKESRRNSILPKDLDTLDDSDFFSRSSTSGFGSDLSKRETLQLLGEL